MIVVCRAPHMIGRRARSLYSPNDLSMATRSKSSDSPSRSARGFAAMDPERQREIAAMGGRASGGNFANDPARAAEAGRAGGRARGSRNTNR